MPVCQVCSREIVPAASPFCSHCGSPNPEAGAGPSGETDTQLLKRRLQAALGAGFTVENELGEGGFAVVFRVLDRKLSRPIAVKVLRPELTASKASKARFVREAETAARLNHPHILPIFFVGENQGLVYFGMPLVDGETLEARLRRAGPMNEKDVIRIGAEVADALAEAHAAGLVHRDIKPLNIMLQGAKGRVLVADFGIAKAAAGSDGDKLTGTGIAIGSPHYMSPEQASGADEVDYRSDIYSLGIVLWQMLVGDPPFERGGSQAVIMQQVSRDVPSVKARRPDVSAVLAAVVARCTRKAREERYQSAEEVAHALRAADASPLARAPRPLRAWLVGTAAVTLLLLAGVLGRTLGRAGTGTRAARAGSDSAGSGPRGAAPATAVLPFSAVTSGDTAQFGRSAALMLGEALALRNGVTTVDGNGLLARWINERRRLTAPLDSNARFAYQLGANQMVMGNYVESGRTFRLALALYDTHDASRLWTDEVTGSTDSLFALIDRLAGRVATALCGQPDYNPGSVCFDTPARPRAPLAVTGTGADTAPVSVFARVAPTGDVSDVRVQGSSADPYATSQALRAIQSARLEPARKAGRPVAAWTTLRVAVRPSSGDVATATTCEASAYGVRNPNGECFDTRPVPQKAPVAAAPTLCRGTPKPTTVLLRVTKDGAVQGAPAVTARSDCSAFDQAASIAASRLSFEPARKAGRPVDAWMQVLVRAGVPDTNSGGR
ncbi:MAG: protein kinase [Gemmatimonadales bacterium]